MVVSVGIWEEVKHWFASRLGVRLAGAHDRYLGLLVVVGCSKRALFQNIRDRFRQRILGWSSKLLSQAGKGSYLSRYSKSFVEGLGEGDEDFWWHNRGDKRVH
ncbi:hypothetical protein Sango_1179600 [Sesamum angolense]|uniref:Reverse transcriptase n=1 Tax=Sesamum angolense TaxID=2727404 RepID=A0AAE1WW49_9LAMI|nr:hypothetical protein Sango_1179600 [Sesamum angolense]